MLEDNNINVQAINIEPPIIIDELSVNEYYIGISRNDKNPANPYWRIKRIWKIGTVWKVGYPNGDQSYTFIWDNRLGYIYS